MLGSIKRKLNKTPLQNSSTIVRSISNLNEELFLEMLTSQHVGEGVFGIEQYSSDSENELYFFTPALQRINIGQESTQIWNWQDYKFHKHLNCYDISLSQPSFLPIYTDTDICLLDDLRLLANNKVNIFGQLLFTKRIDDWRNKVVNQYEAFLRGNDLPSHKRTSRLMQMGLIKAFEKLEGETFKREPIEVIENKILDEGFRAEIRIILMSDSESIINQTEEELKVLLKDYDYFNEFQLNEILKGGKKLFLQDIERRRLSNDTVNQILSFNELQSTMIQDNTTVTPINKPQTKPIITESNPTTNSNSIPTHLLPMGEKQDRDIDNEVVAELPNALKKAKAIKNNNIDIDHVEIGATVQMITCKIPDGIVYSDIKGKTEDIKAVLGNEISVIQGHEPNTVTFLIPCSEREVIYLKELLEDESFLEFAQENALPFICGIDMHNKPVYKDLTKAPHLLVAGATNSGKSVFMNALLITLILLKKPEELKIFLIDPKKVELIQYEGFAHVEKVITDMNEAIETLGALVSEMEDRYEKMSKAKVKKIDGYNKQGKDTMPYIICAIDEYNDLKMQYPEVEDYIARLGQKARASGIHLIIATQRPDKEVMTGVIKSNLPSRISFKLDNTNDYRTVFGTGIPYRNLLGFGDGVVKFVGQTEEFIRFQAPAITLDDDIEEQTFENVKKFYKGEIVSNLELKEPKETIPEDPVDRAKKVIANTGDFSIDHLQKQLGIRRNDVVELRKQLVEEGWLQKNGNRYELIVDDEELLNWKDQ